MRIPRYKKGDIVICPNCKDHIATLNLDVFEGMPVSEHLFKGIQREIKHGQLMECIKCKANYFENYQLRTIPAEGDC